MGYGGALIYTGLAKNLKREHPEKKIIFLFKLNLKNLLFFRKNKDFEVYKNNPDILLVINKLLWFFVRIFYKKKDKIIIDLENKKYHYWEKDTPNRIFYKKNGHAIYLALESFELKNILLETKIVLNQNEKDIACKILGKNNLLNKKYICIEPNTKKTFTVNKQWPLKNWQELINLINKFTAENKIDCKIVQIGSPKSPNMDGVINLSGLTTFRQVKEIIDRSCLLIANEGGMAHLASGSDTISVIICNPSLPKNLMTYPKNINIFPLNGNMHDCGLKKTCDTCQEMLNSITPNYVLDKIKHILINQIT